MSKPIRVQRKRTKGFKLPENTVCVNRGTAYGNPFNIGCYAKLGKGGNGMMYIKTTKEYATGDYVFVADNSIAVDLYEKLLAIYPLRKELIEKLKDKNLACFCPLNKPCHADVLLKIANS